MVWAPVPWGSYDRWSMLLLTALLCSLAAWHLLALVLADQPLRSATREARVPLLLLIVVAIWQWIQSATISVSPYDTRDMALLATGFAAAAFLLTELVTTRPRALFLVRVLLIAAAAQAVFAIGNLYTGERYQWFGDKGVNPAVTTGTFWNRNHFAAYMAVGLSLGIGMMVAQLNAPARSWRQFARNMADLVLSGKAALRILLVLLVIALILTRSRMGNMGFFISLTGTAVIWALLTRHLSRGFVLFLASIVILDLALVGTWFGVEQVAERIQQTTIEEEERGNVLVAMLPMIRDHWLLGTGGGTFRVSFNPYRTADIGVAYRNAHNDYAQVLVELGVIGAACLGAFWLWCLLGSLGLIGSRDKWFRGMGFGGVMLASYVALHSSVEFNLYIPGLALQMLVALTLLGIVLPSLRKHASRATSSRRFAPGDRRRTPPDPAADRPETSSEVSSRNA